MLWFPAENTNDPVQFALLFRDIALLLKWSIVAFSSSHKSKKLLNWPLSPTLS